MMLSDAAQQSNATTYELALIIDAIFDAADTCAAAARCAGRRYCEATTLACRHYRRARLPRTLVSFVYEPAAFSPLVTVRAGFSPCGSSPCGMISIR